MVAAVGVVAAFDGVPGMVGDFEFGVGEGAFFVHHVEIADGDIDFFCGFFVFTSDVDGDFEGLAGGLCFGAFDAFVLNAHGFVFQDSRRGVVSGQSEID